ncbi:MAG: hypothetical protein QN720_11815, partial [Nitrososphaeraceae archaeon]|nr:hypothetical protein [Nitrososphaeraceae archaeon]MDW0333631.1 hypothetical protein [Nitrososphaeraceae archaeon]
LATPWLTERHGYDPTFEDTFGLVVLDIEYLCLQSIGLFVVLQQHPTDYSLGQVTAVLYYVSNLPFFLFFCCYH